jgi:hypothetical protein
LGVAGVFSIYEVQFKRYDLRGTIYEVRFTILALIVTRGGVPPFGGQGVAGVFFKFSIFEYRIQKTEFRMVSFGLLELLPKTADLFGRLADFSFAANM